MKKILFVLFIFIVLTAACQKAPEPKAETKTLSDMQITACDTANDAGTCDTRLAELGIVSKEDCCKALEKCC